MRKKLASVGLEVAASAASLSAGPVHHVFFGVP